MNYKKALFISLILFILTRGIMLICVLPPFEGWDEYQHIAYIQYLNENHKQPILNHSKVPLSLLSKIQYFPQPVHMTTQTGGMDYKTFFLKNAPPDYEKSLPDIMLYQAQHGSLYYYIVKELFTLSGGIDNLSESVSSLRIFNLLLTIISIIGCMVLIYKLTFPNPHKFLLLLIIACQPLYLLNGVRVANDALAVFFGTFVIIWALDPKLHNKLLFAIPVGCMLGFGIWAKSTDLILLPFVFLCLMLSIIQRSITMKKGFFLCCIVITAAFITASPNILHNLKQYDTISPMQEALKNHEKGKTIFDILSVGLHYEFPMRMYNIWIRSSTWFGGWSFLSLNYLKKGIQCLLITSILGWIYSFYKLSNPKTIFKQKDFTLRCFLLVCCISIGLYWHMLHSYVAWEGVITTNPWYACMGFPFALALAYEGVNRLNAKFGIIYGWLIVFTYFFSETSGMLTKMIPHYSGGIHSIEALQRIAKFHPAWLGLTTFISSLLIMCCLFICIIILWFRINKQYMETL